MDMPQRVIFLDLRLMNFFLVTLGLLLFDTDCMDKACLVLFCFALLLSLAFFFLFSCFYFLAWAIFYRKSLVMIDDFSQWLYRSFC